MASRVSELVQTWFYQATLTDLVLISWMFVLLPLISSSQSACPLRCTCDLTRNVVECQGAGLRHLPWNLPMPMELSSLDLSRNEIREINAQITYSNLKFLDLSNNQIAHISEDILRDLPNLEVLYLKKNHLMSLQENVFDGMDSLRCLDLSENNLSDLQLPLFDELSSLEDLNMAGNVIANVSAEAFYNMHSLYYLNLEDNQLNEVKEDMFTSVQSLKTLNLGYNKLRSLPNGAFSQLQHLRELNLQANQLTDLPVEVFFSGSSGDGPVSSLEKLDLRNNRLMSVPSSALSYLSNLEWLDLSQNPMVEVATGAFHGFSNLRFIQLNTMPDLAMVRQEAFVDLGNLLELEMHSNRRLSSIEDGAFEAVPQLRKVDLHANNLQTLSGNLLEWSEIRLLDLRYNPWQCDCHLSWMPSALKHHASNSTIYITQDVRCDSPDSLKGTLIISSAESLGNCQVTVKPEKFQDHIMISIMCTIGGILVVVIVILMCKYGKSYSRAYAPAMDQYVYRNPSKLEDVDIECQRVPVIEGDMSMSRNLRSSLSSTSGIGAPARSERRLYRVRFADSSPMTTPTVEKS